MPKRILIDSIHSEEIRSVVLENGRVQEFDSETAIKQQIKGNIYLGKVTRVEPSLQAAFVEYGGNRQGFLPFSDIHPDYYGLPTSDKQELLESLKKANVVHDDEDEEPQQKNASKESSDTEGDDNEVEESGADEEHAHDPADKNLYRRYKIQEVIKRNQIVLVQVAKEERGNKGASLTTFVSLAGKYCVLMPNALRQGGVSRRISSYEDRKRLRRIIKELQIPDEAGLIVRTAGVNKGTDEIKRDYDYLVRLWNQIRERTLSSEAPAFIHAEGDLIKRVIRDLYNESYDELLIEGGDAFAEAKEFMKIIMPTHADRVKQYKNKVPIFSRYKVEEQIAKFYHHEAELESGGSIVINPTEALISIDVNSGKATTQRSVEETALSTNLEAAKEIARQLRLRDLSGLIVIDFIDMLELKNRKAVERAVKDAFKEDRAKIQIGRISTFGLLEMSRQRLRPSFLEINTVPCGHCNGSGTVKAPATTAVTILRALEAEVTRSKQQVKVRIDVVEEVALYLLNHKRESIETIERRHDTSIVICIDRTLDKESFVIDIKTQGGEKPNSNQKKRPANTNADSEQNEEEGRKRSRSKKKKADSKRSRPNEGGAITSILDGLWKKIID
jgi:ribonuclease E